jgi:hypothetical protein
VKKPVFEVNPVIRQSEKHPSKACGRRPTHGKKQLVCDMTPQGSRDCQCENAEGHCRHDKQKREKIEAKRAVPEERHRSVYAQREAIQ